MKVLESQFKNLNNRDLLVAAFMAYLRYYCAFPDVVVGLKLPGRRFEAMESLVGRYENVVPLRWQPDLQSGASFREVLFSYDRIPRLSGLPFEEYSLPSGPVLSALRVKVVEDDIGAHRITVEAISEVDVQKMLGTFVSNFVSMLSFSLDNFDSPLNNFSFGSFVDGNAGARRAIAEFQSSPASLISTFEVRCQQLFGEPAVMEDRGSTLTFHELNRAANRLCRLLTSMPNARRGPGLVNVLCIMPPSTGMVMALVGIVKTGACCIPIDSNDPDVTQSFVARVFDQVKPDYVLLESTSSALVADLPDDYLLFVDLLGDQLAGLSDSNVAPDIGDSSLLYGFCSRDALGDVAIQYRTQKNLLSDIYTLRKYRHLVGALSPTPIGLLLELFISDLNQDPHRRQLVLRMEPCVLWSTRMDDKYLLALSAAFAFRALQLFQPSANMIVLMGVVYVMTWHDTLSLEVVGRCNTKLDIEGASTDLDEVTSVISEFVDVRAACVVLVESPTGDKELAAYIEPKPGAELSIVRLDQFLRGQLRPESVPRLYSVCPSGLVFDENEVPKISELPPAVSPFSDVVPITSAGELMNNLEKAIYDVVCKELGLEQLSLDTSIVEIPGFELSKAAAVTSSLRKTLSCPVPLDLFFRFPTIRNLASELNKVDLSEQGLLPGDRFRRDFHTLHSKRAKPLTPRSMVTIRHLIQLVGLIFLFIITMINLVPPIAMVVYIYLEISLWAALVSLPAMYIGFALCSSITTLVCKWALIGRYRSGTYPLWGWYYFRWWMVNRVVHAHRAYTGMLRGTPLLNSWFRLLGASIADRVLIDTDQITEFDLVTIEEGTRVGVSTRLSPVVIENDSLILRRIRIGKFSDIGAKSYLSGGCTVHSYSTLSALSVVPYNTSIPSHEHFAGSPLRKVGSAHRTGNLVVQSISFMSLSFQLFILLVITLLSSVSTAPSIYLAHLVWSRLGLFWLVFLAPSLWLLASIVYAVLVCGVRRFSATQMDIHAEVLSARSAEAARAWFNSALFMSPALKPFLDQFSGSVISTWFYRALGARIGRNVFIHIATESLGMLNLVSIGDNSVLLGGSTLLLCENFEAGLIRRSPIVIGDGVIIGGGSVLLPGALVPSHATVCPNTRIDGSMEVKSGSVWSGSPPLHLFESPQSVVADAIRARGGRAAEHWPWLLLEAIGQLVIPMLSLALPLPTIFIIETAIYSVAGWPGFFLLSPLCYGVFAVASFVVVLLGKWFCFGALRSDKAYKIFGGKVLGWTLFAALQRYARSVVLECILGTEFCVSYWRAMGAKVDRNVYIDSMDCLEYELLDIGSNTVIGERAVLSGLTMHPLHFSTGKVVVKDGSTVGPRAYLSPGSTLQERVIVGPGTTTLEGEILTEDHYWEGNPSFGVHIDISRPMLGERSLSIDMNLDRMTTVIESAFLLDRLVAEDQHVFCLVRANSKEHGALRIKKRLQELGLWRTSYEFAITPVPGDLTSPQLGLDDETWLHLAKVVDVVVHCAAVVDFRKEYDELYPVNVNGTKHILEFCAGERPKYLHYIGTLAVFNPISDLRVDETDVPTGRGLIGGYAQTKFQSELLVLQASQPASIYRLGRIISLERAADAQKQFPYILLRTILDMKAYPIDINAPLDMIPADLCATILAHFIEKARSPFNLRGAKHASGRVRVFHIVHPRPVTIPTACRWLVERGYMLEGVLYSRWRQLLLHTAATQATPLGALVDFFDDGLEGAKWARFRCDRTLRDAELTGFTGHVMDVDAEYLTTYLDTLLAPRGAAMETPPPAVGGMPNAPATLVSTHSARRSATTVSFGAGGGAARAPPSQDKQAAAAPGPKLWHRGGCCSLDVAQAVADDSLDSEMGVGEQYLTARASAPPSATATQVAKVRDGRLQQGGGKHTRQQWQHGQLHVVGQHLYHLVAYLKAHLGGPP
ncbi:Nonribosomal peptide synthetase 4 [Cladochytrium tenue]|nr:Nonribosomal peptide synthetase 4 [Cladochytrium tenue]